MTGHLKLAEHRLKLRVERSLCESGVLAAWVVLAALMLVLVAQAGR